MVNSTSRVKAGPGLPYWMGPAGRLTDRAARKLRRRAAAGRPHARRPDDPTDHHQPSSTRRLFGGTFDPPHVGHLVTAVNVRHALDLDVVVLMVANVPWQKEASRSITPALDRLAMVEAAVADVPGLEAGRLEIDRRGPSYTADTLAALASEDSTVELFTIVGDDAAAGLNTWERHEEVVARSRLVVVDRPGEPVQLAGDVPWIHVEVPRLEVSSTDLRAPSSPTAARSPTSSPTRCSTSSRSAACTGRTRDGPPRPSLLLGPRRHGCRRRRRRLGDGVGILGAVTLYHSTEGADAASDQERVEFPATPTS